MTTEQRDRVEALFDAALDLPIEGRWIWLKQQCTGDEGLFREAEALLKAHESAEGVFERYAGNVVSALARALTDEEPEDETLFVGPYRILKELGRGGMGVVYLALRTDVGLKVALKLIHRFLFEPELKARFLIERKILARLEHPHIARLLDAGVTSDELPFFAMEYVEGSPISMYCRERHLSIRDRLRLFRQVCSAVSYAHQNSIIHRDLKPGNILVYDDPDGKPCVKLLDFGIAKLVDDTDVDNVFSTRTGIRPMTPQYAAPEQVRGETVTTATDIYALGLLLYELLTDRLPYEIDGLAPSQVERVVCEVIPLRPSTVVKKSAAGTETSPGETIFPDGYKNIGGDLDAITMKALHKEPHKRYSSIDRLADDLERFLDGRAVEARGDTYRYRAGKFVRRHRWGVLAAAGFLALLLGYGITITVQAGRIRDALARAQEEEKKALIEAEKSRDVTTFLMGLFEASDPDQAKGVDLTAQDLLQQGLKKASLLGKQPAVQAQMYDMIGQVYQSLGDPEEARPLLEQAFAIRKKIFGMSHAETAASLDNLGVLYLELGDHNRSQQLFRQALGIIETVKGRDHPDVARSLNNLAGTYFAQGDFAVAESLHWKVVDIERKQLGPEHLNVSNSLNNLSVLYRRKGDYEKAESLQREALAIRRKHLGEEHPDVARSMNNLAVLLKYREKYAEAEQLHRKTLVIRKKLLGDRHPEVAISLTNLAAVLRVRNSLGESESLVREALEIDRDVLGRRHPVVAKILLNLGDVLTDREKYPEAENTYLEAESIQLELLGPDHIDTRDTRKALEQLYTRWGKPDLASRYQGSDS